MHSISMDAFLWSFLGQKYIILLFLVTIFAYFLLRRDPRIKRYLKKLPGPMGFPALGSAIPMMCPENEIFPTIGNWFLEYGTTFGFWIGNIIPYVFTCDVNVIEKLISGHKFINKGKYEYTLFSDWLGTGLLLAPGTKWFSRRKMLTPAFHFNILEQFLPIFNEQANILINCLGKDGRDDGASFDLHPYLSKCTLDIICETAMGKKMNIQGGSDNQEYFEAVEGMCHLFIYKNARPWLRIPQVYQLTSTYTKEQRFLEILKSASNQVIASQRAERKLVQSTVSSDSTEFYGKKRKAFLDLLLDVADETQQLTDADIQEEVDTFMFAGHDTTSISLGWTILLLAMHPEYQETVQNELDSIFTDNLPRDVTTADISKMRFLECCVRESLRLFPSVPLIARQLDSDLLLDNGSILPKNVTTVISVYNLHRLPEHFPEPDKFRPERWSADTTLRTSERQHPYKYIPFSAGPRGCIGQKFAVMEEKVILARLFQTYNVKTNLKYEDIKVLPIVVLHCENGINVRLHRRTTISKLIE